MCTVRILFSHILNYSFVHSISHLLYGSFQLYYGWIWNVLRRLLSLISSPALLSRQMEGPWMKWVTGNGPWYWTAQPCFLSSQRPVPVAAKMEASSCHMVPLPPGPLLFLPPSFRTQVQTNPSSFLRLLLVRYLGSSMRKATKMNFFRCACVSVYHKH